jgi:membrane protease YdiL (CAAX protease family)
MSFVGRHPVLSYLVLAFAIFWVSWLPVLLLGAPPRPFSAVGAILGLALPAFLVTAATDGRAGVPDLLRRTLRWRVGVGWYLLAILAIPVGALLLAPLFLGAAPLERLPQNWNLLFTEFLPQLRLALVTVQFFEELGWAGFVQHRLQSRHGALKASLLVALAFAFLHLATYLSAPVSAESALRDLSFMVIVIPFAICFPDPDHLRLQPHGLQRPHRRHHPHLLQRSIRNHRTERARTTGPGSRVRLSRTVGTSRRGDQQRHAGLQPRSQSGCAPGCLRATPARRSTRAPSRHRRLPRRAGGGWSLGWRHADRDQFGPRIRLR